MRSKSPSRLMKASCYFSRLIDEEYTRHPFYGSRKMVVFLEDGGSHRQSQAGTTV